MALRPKSATGSSPAGETTLGPDIRVKGRIEGAEDLRVEGRVDGSIRLSETVFVEEGGVVVATIEGRDVVVSGVVVGNVNATNSITLNRGAKLVGDLVAPRVIIGDGASFRGNVQMTGEPSRPRERPRVAASHRPASVAPPVRRSVPTPRASTPARSESRSRAAAPPPPPHDDVTVVVRHAALRGGARGSGAPEFTPDNRNDAASGPAKKQEASQPTRPAQKVAPRAKLPARGKRKIARR